MSIAKILTQNLTDKDLHWQVEALFNLTNDLTNKHNLSGSNSFTIGAGNFLSDEKQFDAFNHDITIAFHFACSKVMVAHWSEEERKVFKTALHSCKTFFDTINNAVYGDALTSLNLAEQQRYELLYKMYDGRFKPDNTDAQKVEQLNTAKSNFYKNGSVALIQMKADISAALWTLVALLQGLDIDHNFHSPQIAISNKNGTTKSLGPHYAWTDITTDGKFADKGCSCLINEHTQVNFD